MSFERQMALKGSTIENRPQKYPLLRARTLKVQSLLTRPYSLRTRGVCTGCVDGCVDGCVWVGVREFVCVPAK